MQNRIGSCVRNTKETQIELEINLDGSGEAAVDTGIPFFDHMLNGFARHGLFDLRVRVKGEGHRRPGRGLPSHGGRHRDRARRSDRTGTWR